MSPALGSEEVHGGDEERARRRDGAQRGGAAKESSFLHLCPPAPSVFSCFIFTQLHTSNWTVIGRNEATDTNERTQVKLIRVERQSDEAGSKVTDTRREEKPKNNDTLNLYKTF
ncbi:hypothetical protein GBF38_013761 [Nibea albiflora]|uniref:Uncharacterized protein n=1 Tax=Nibea albiflora TaxID=240163 RepID=A0ACB7FCZ9_NIBAL|nr:hypothetical protein GBF38_013761 [Nibea albiflora]